MASALPGVLTIVAALLAASAGWFEVSMTDARSVGVYASRSIALHAAEAALDACERRLAERVLFIAKTAPAAVGMPSPTVRRTSMPMQPGRAGASSAEPLMWRQPGGARWPAGMAAVRELAGRGCAACLPDRALADCVAPALARLSDHGTRHRRDARNDGLVATAACIRRYASGRAALAPGCGAAVVREGKASCISSASWRAPTRQAAVPAGGRVRASRSSNWRLRWPWRR
ncbi:hypothetical protein [Burkholderia glumae]|uniref:hypothetical protein n=1 Tax=Burkholderia glumae TaxID=337 RepID=UPI00345E46A3